MPIDPDHDDDPGRWRLSWPGETPAAEAPRAEGAPAAAPPVERSAAPLDPVEPASSPAGTTASYLGPAPDDAARVARFVVDAYDRLGDRMGGEMRSFHNQVDLDLASLRSELASLRRSLGDSGEREHLRQLRTAVDELRDDVTALRQVVLDWPELEEVRANVASIRASLGRGRPLAATSSASAPPELERLLQDLRDEVAGLVPMVDEVAGLRAEVAALRRRIALRADR